MEESVAFDAAQSSYRIDDRQSGRRVSLAWQGPSPMLPLRWLALAAALAVLGGAAWFATTQVLPVVRKEAVQAGGDAIGMAILGSILTVGCCVAAFYIVSGVGRFAAYVSQATWDAADQAMEIVQSGWMLFGRRRLRPGLSTISSLEMTVGAELPAGALPITIKIDLVSALTANVVLPLPIVGIDTRAAALELFFDLARIAGFGSYVVLRNDARVLRVSALRDGQPDLAGDMDEDDEDDEDLDELDEDAADEDDDSDDEDTSASAAEADDYPVPGSSRAASYFEIPSLAGSDRPSPALVHAFEEPVEAIPPVDTDALAGPSDESWLVEWDPPRLARFARAAVPRSVVIVAAVVCAIAGAIVGAWPLHGLTESISAVPPSRWETGLLGALVAAFLAGFLVWALNRPREVTIDCTAGTITCCQGEQVRSYRTDQVCEVALIGEKDRRPENDSPGSERLQYRCRIELGVAQSDEWVFDSAAWQPSRAVPYRRMLPVAMELARMLNVPFRWQDFDAPSKAAWHSRLGWKERGVLAALALALVGYLANQAIRTNVARQVADSLRITGADVSFMNGYSIQDHLVLANYWQITIKPDQFDLDKLRAITERIADLDRVGLVLEDTGLGDAAMPAIGTVKNLLLLDANSTNVTSDGVEALAGLDQLVYLSLANTIVGDAGLERLPPLASLKFLNLSTTNLTDRGIDELAKFPSLEYVSLYNLHISDAAVERLRAARPKLEIKR